MSEIIQTIRALPRLASIDGASINAITDAETQLQLKFSKEYCEYLAEFGSISAKGIELTGIIEEDYCNVVFATKQEWTLNPNVPHTMYVIENTYVDGIIVWQNEAGTIYQTSPNSAPKQIATSLVDYILRHKNYT